MFQCNTQGLITNNSIVQGVYDENIVYFSKILSNYKCKFRLTGQDLSMFAQACVEEILSVLGGGQGNSDVELGEDECTADHNKVGPLEIIRMFIMDIERRAEKKLTDDLKELCQILIKESVESERNEALKKILQWINKIAETNKFKELLKGIKGKYGWDEITTTDQGFWINNSMMARACMKDDFEMVYTFRSNHFNLHPVTDEICHPGEHVSDKNAKKAHNTREFMWGDLLKGKVQEFQPNILLEYKYFAARSMPAYMLANYLHHISHYSVDSDDSQNNKKKAFATDPLSAFPITDPISAAFFNAHIARNKSYVVLENANKYKAVENRCKKFVETMLDLCKNNEEAKTFVDSEKHVDNYFDTSLRFKVRFPRIVIALKDNHMDFVAHDFIQQILRDSWYTNEKTGDECRANTYNIYEHLLYLLMVMVSMPVCAILYPISLFYSGKKDSDTDPSWFDICWVKLFFFYNLPYNRFLTQMLTNIYFIVIIMLVIINPQDDPNSVDVDFYDYLIVVYAFAFLLRDLKERWNYGASSLFRSKPLFYFNIILRSVLLVGVTLRGYAYYEVCQIYHSYSTDTFDPNAGFFKVLENCTLDTPADIDKNILNPNDPHFLNVKVILRTGYILYGLGTIMATLLLLNYAQLLSFMAPIVATIKAVWTDILLVGCLVATFGCSFSLGLHYIALVPAKNETCAEEKNETNSSIQGWRLDAGVNQFRNINSTLKAVFWSLFDPGHPEVVGCMQGVPRYAAQILWGVYQLTLLMILTNVLIALMNSTRQKIQASRLQVWKFSRTVIQMPFFDKRLVLPAPLNIIEYIGFAIFCAFRKLAKGEQFNNNEIECEDLKERQKRYEKMVGDICGRYLNLKDDSKENEVTNEDLDNAAKDISRTIKMHRK